MADNFAVKNGAGASVTLRSKDVGAGVQAPAHVIVGATGTLITDFATETTLATLGTQATLATLGTEATLATLGTQATLAALAADIARAAVTAVQADVALAQANTIHTPAEGKKIRLSYICLSADAANNAPTTATVKLGTVTLYKVSLAAGAVWSRDLSAGRRYAEGLADALLTVTLSAAKSVFVSAELAEA